jgi:nucleotide-binding universal stress UspA family protein
MYRHILVAVDGSHTAEQALREACSLAGTGVSITALCVVENPVWTLSIESGAYDAGLMREALLDGGKAVLEKSRQQAAEQGVTIATRLLDLTLQLGGTIADAILQAARNEGADLLVIGTHGRRGVRRLLMGSVAEALLRQSPLPVLLVRSAE